MTNEMEMSICGRVVAAVNEGRTRRDLRGIEAQLISEETEVIQDWINAHSVVDKFYLVFILHVAAEGLESQLTDTEKELLAELRDRLGAAVISVPGKGA